MAIAYADTPVLVASAPELDRQLNTDIPVLLYIWDGETIKTDLKNELDRVAREYSGRILVVKADTSRAPEIGERFEVGRHPIMIGYLKGEQLGRRNRPWASDVGGMVEILEPHAPKPAAVPAPKKEEKPAGALDKPVKVTEANFEQEVLKSNVPVLVDFWAEWCGPCKQIAPALEKLAREFAGKVKIAKLNVDENPRLAQMFGVQGIPNLMFVKGGKIVGQQAGALPEHVLRNAINQLIALKL